MDVIQAAHHFAAATTLEVGERQAQQVLAVVQHHLQLQFLAEMAHQQPLQQVQQGPQQEQHEDADGQAAQHLAVTTNEHVVGEDLHQQRHAQRQHTGGQIEAKGLQQQGPERQHVGQKSAEPLASLPAFLGAVHRWKALGIWIQ